MPIETRRIMCYSTIISSEYVFFGAAYDYNDRNCKINKGIPAHGLPCAQREYERSAGDPGAGPGLRQRTRLSAERPGQGPAGQQDAPAGRAFDRYLQRLFCRCGQSGGDGGPETRVQHHPLQQRLQPGQRAGISGRGAALPGGRRSGRPHPGDQRDLAGLRGEAGCARGVHHTSGERFGFCLCGPCGGRGDGGPVSGRAGLRAVFVYRKGI